MLAACRLAGLSALDAYHARGQGGRAIRAALWGYVAQRGPLVRNRRLTVSQALDDGRLAPLVVANRANPPRVCGLQLRLDAAGFGGRHRYGRFEGGVQLGRLLKVHDLIPSTAPE
jgi:hypothetical protein